MKINLPVAILTSFPLIAGAWLLGSDLMLRDPMTSSLVYTSPVRSLIHQQRQQLQNLMNREFLTQASPRYEITDGEDTFKIMVEVPGMTKDDVQVSLEDNGKFLSIKGSHQTKEEGYGMSSSFTQSFLLDPSVDVDQITANLKDGVLVVTAPKDMKKLEANVRKIPITYQEDGASIDTKKTDNAEEAAQNKIEAEHATA